MGGSLGGDRTDEVAAEILAAMDGGRQIPPLAARLPGFDLAAAYRVTHAVRRLREARGERPIGRKIGFTNRTIWDEYGVHAPIWGPMYDSTVAAARDGAGTLSIGRLLEPRIEPEIVFGLASAPEAGMDEADLLGCVAWVAHGCEVVQSLFPGWIFAPADTVAALGLHGAYLVGARVAVEAADRPRWLADLARFDIVLSRGQDVVDTGHAANVLGGPLSALRHLVGLLAQDTLNPPLAAGEMVTTGTVTRAFPVRAGETWSTRIDGLPLPGLQVSFT